MYGTKHGFSILCPIISTNLLVLIYQQGLWGRYHHNHLTSMRRNKEWRHWTSSKGISRRWKMKETNSGKTWPITLTRIWMTGSHYAQFFLLAIFCYLSVNLGFSLITGGYSSKLTSCTNSFCWLHVQHRTWSSYRRWGHRLFRFLQKYIQACGMNHSLGIRGVVWELSPCTFRSLVRCLFVGDAKYSVLM